MQGNDISSEFQPTYLVIFEGLLGIPPEGHRKRPWWISRTSNAHTEIAAYGINTLLLNKIRHVPCPVEVVTFLGPQYIRPIEQRLEDLHALVRRVWYTSPQELTRIHLTTPDIAAIYDPDRTRAFAAYGALGHHLLPGNAAQFGEQ